MDSVILEYKDTGICKVDIDKIVRKWNHLWWISQWHDEYRLIKYKRKDSPITSLKVTISKDQVTILTEKLGLEKTPDTTFRYAASWRKSEN